MKDLLKQEEAVLHVTETRTACKAP